MEVAEVMTEGYEDMGECFTVAGQHIGRVVMSDLELQPGQHVNDDVGLHPLQRGALGRTAATIAERVATGHRSGDELETFWTELAVCHQAEAEHPPVDEDLQAYRDQNRQDAASLMADAQAMILQGDGQAAIKDALAKATAAVKCELDEYPADRDAKIAYSAASPDDKALVEGAAAVGFVFLARRNGRVVVRILGELREYTILSVIPFDSDRKRMSVITELVVPEVEAAYQLTNWLAEHYDPSATQMSATLETELIKTQPLFAALHRRREEIIAASALKTTVSTQATRRCL